LFYISAKNNWQGQFGVLRPIQKVIYEDIATSEEKRLKKSEI